MDQQKAGEISALYQKANAIRRRIKEYRVKAGEVGSTTIMVDCSWLPSIIQIAETQLAEIEAQIEEL